MGALRALERRLMGLEKALLTALVLVMAVLSFAQVLLRGFFSAGILWADTFLRHLVLWVAFLGAAAAAGEDKQFAMDAAQRLFSGRARALVHSVGHAFAAAVCALLARASWTFFEGEYRSGAVLFSAAGMQVPTWAFELILPAGFALLCAHYLIKLVLAAEGLRR